MLASEGLSDLPFNLAFIYLFFLYLFIYFYRKLFVVAVQP